MRIVRVALDISLRNTFDYSLPEEMSVEIGCRVLVPLSTQKRVAIVTALPERSEITELKPIIQVLDTTSIFDEQTWNLLLWSRDYYHHPIGEVLFSALPVKLRKGEALLQPVQHFYQLTSLGKQALEQNILHKKPRQHELLSFLQRHQYLEKQSDIFSYSIKKTLLDQKYIEIIELDIQRTPWTDLVDTEQFIHHKNKLVLNKEQALAVSQISLLQGFHVWLLQGVTGSGKTEVYLQVIEEVLRRGQQVLVLVPEIGLTPQTIRRFNLRFNVPIAVLHSNLTENERLQVWQDTKDNKVAIVIGTRSAIFTQFHDLGVIILDEEHDLSFKQQDGWRYHARDMAVYRANLHKIPIILGSATPSLESLYNVERKKYHLISLRYRANHQIANNQLVIDLKNQYLEHGLSTTLLLHMKTILAQGGQVLLFLNRRGFAPVYLCHDCGTVEICEHCNRPYTYHQMRHILQCHHCGAQKPIPFQCAHCGSTHLLTTGLGTEQLEQALHARFPEYQIVRLDRDSTAKKGMLEHYLQEIAQGKHQILIGTQMLAKGHHFPNVGLVGLINIDNALFSADFRAEERLAQLYVQVAGRTGRGDKAGEVLLQTHYPEHPLFTSLISAGYTEFSQKALVQRQQLQLPPYYYQALIRASGKNEEQVKMALQQLSGQIQANLSTTMQDIQLIGPLPATIEKRAGRYRWYLLLQHAQRNRLHQVLFLVEQLLTMAKGISGVRISLDIDPYDFS